MTHRLINNTLSVKEGIINFYITVKPINRLTEANIITLLRQTAHKIEDME
jgi:hypothetical protein